MTTLAIHRIGKALLGPGTLSLEGLPEEFQKRFPEVSPKYIDTASLLAGIAAIEALRGSDLTEEERRDFSVVLGSALGTLESVLGFDGQALQKGPNAVNPMDFPNTVANAPGSRVGIWLQLKGPNVTLTNGGTAFLDALGFAWEAAKGGLFQRGLVGAVERVPDSLRILVRKAPEGGGIQEGACLLLADREEGGAPLFRVEDYFSLQLGPGLLLPPAFIGRWRSFWEGVRWLGCPTGTPLLEGPPTGMMRWTPPPGVDLGLGGLGAMEAFLASPHPLGVLGAYAPAERKMAFVRITKK
jgi:hypothetical protein